MPSDERQLDLRDYLRIVWRRRWLVLLCVVTLPTAVYTLSARADKIYQAAVTLQVQPQTVDTSLFPTDAQPQGQPGRALAAAARLVKTPVAAEEAAKRLEDPPANPRRSLLPRITVETEPIADFVTIAATHGNPARAAAIANAFAEALIQLRRRDATEQITSAITEIRRAIDDLRRDDTAGREQLSEQLQRLRALRAAQGRNARIIERAAAATAPIAPRPLRNALVALLLALALAAGLVFVLERLNRRIADTHELRRITGLPLLATVPRSAFTDGAGEGHALEAFQTLRANLGYLNVDGPLKSVLISSALEKEGKTTVAVNLALAMARANKNVVLIDADLRRATVGERLGLARSPGLEAVLAAEVALPKALQEVEVAAGRLRVLPGLPVELSSELIASTRMRRLLETLSGSVDVIVIDSTPLLPVGDAIPLLDLVDGVIMVARIGQTDRDALKRAIEIVGAGSGDLVGVVATGTEPAESYGGYGYRPDPTRMPPPASKGRADLEVDRKARRLFGRNGADGGNGKPAAKPGKSGRSLPVPPEPRARTKPLPKRP